MIVNYQPTNVHIYCRWIYIKSVEPVDKSLCNTHTRVPLATVLYLLFIVVELLGYISKQQSIGNILKRESNLRLIAFCFGLFS